MSYGRLIEVGTPRDLYMHPQTEFVASFLGTANILLGKNEKEHIQIGPHVFGLTKEATQFSSDGRVQVLFRPEDVAGRFTLRQVSFQYPGRRAPALRDVTLEIPAGHAVALVGPSGAGKSTLCDVIARFHDPTEGVVELDGIDIRKIELQSYRRLIAVVEQDVFLFEGTIRENLAYGARDAATPAHAGPGRR